MKSETAYADAEWPGDTVSGHLLEETHYDEADASSALKELIILYIMFPSLSVSPEYNVSSLMAETLCPALYYA